MLFNRDEIIYYEQQSDFNYFAVAEQGAVLGDDCYEYHGTDVHELRTPVCG